MMGKLFWILLVALAASGLGAAHSSDERPTFFRYKAGLVSLGAPQDGGPGDPFDPGNYDVHAKLLGIVGEEFESAIPSKPGATVVSWRVERGILPQGLNLDSETGVIHGVPAAPVSERKIYVTGYAPSGEKGTRAEVEINILEARSYARSQTAYGHTGKPFYAQLSRPSGVTVYSWHTVEKLPVWAVLVNGSIQGVPPSSGVWPLALSGTDHSGREVAFVHGQIIVEDGPQVGFIADQERHRSDEFGIFGRVSHRLGEIAWSVEGDPLPSGMSLNRKTGQLKGRIPSFGTSLRLRLKAVDIDGTVGHSNWFTLSTLPAELALGSVPTQHLTVGVPASIKFSASESAGPQTWTVESGSLPDGLSLDAVSGRISGVPSVEGTWSGIVVRLTDSAGTQASNPFDIVVHPETVTANVAPVDARVGVPFTGHVPEVAGGKPPYTFRLADGSELPPGVDLDEQTGVLSGVLGDSGSQSAFLVAVDSTGNVGRPFVAGLTGYMPLSASMEKDVYEVTRLSHAAIVPLLAEGSAIPVESWSVSPTALPSGMSFSSATGSIFGRPDQTGVYGPYTLTVRDASSETAQAGPFTIVVNDLPPIEVDARDVEVERLVEAEVRPANVENSVGDVIWSLSEDSAPLPPGLRLDLDGFIRGVTSATSASYGVIVEAVDSEARKAVSEPFSVTPVQPGPIEVSDIEMRWPAGFEFTASVRVSNTAGSWTAEAASSLPTWLSLDSSGILSGVAPSEGTFGPFQIHVRDEAGRTAVASFTLEATGPLALSLSVPELSRLSEVDPIRPDAANAVGELSWSLSGRLPEGLSFDSSSGYVTGAPLEEGSFHVEFSATDRAGQHASLSVALSVGPRKDLSVFYSVPKLVRGTSKGLPLFPKQPVNAALPVEFAVSGTLPPGLTFDRKTGAFAGIPTTAGLFPGVVVTAQDAEGQAASSGPLTFRVEPEGDIYVSSPVKVSLRLGTYGETPPVPIYNAVSPLVFSTSSGQPFSDPDGLVFIEENGSIVGTPSTAGKRTYALKVTDVLGRSAPFALELSAVGDFSVAMDDVHANVNSPISGATARVTNAIGSVTYSVAPALPSGFHFNESTGAVSGTPTQEGDFGPFTLAAVDSTGAESTATFIIRVGPRLPLAASFSSGSVTAIAHKQFKLTPKAKNAVGQVTWSLETGVLPDGLSLNSTTGVISGRPTMTGTWSGIVLRAVDATGAEALTPALTITVELDGKPIALSPKSLQWKRGMAFVSDAPSVSNAVGDLYFWSPEAEALGLSVDTETGVVSGVIDEPGDYIVHLIVTDASDRVSEASMTLRIIPNLRLTAGPVYATVNRSMTAVRPVVVDYSIGTVTYELIGSLPAGLSFSPSTGKIGGTPTELGLFEGLAIAATDGAGDYAVSNPFMVEVLDNGTIPTITGMPAVQVLREGTAWSGVTPNVAYKKTGDVYTIEPELPEGLVLDPATGRISGTPADGTHGIYEGYVISVADTLGRGTSSPEFSIRIRHRLSPTFNNFSAYFRKDLPFVTPPIEPAFNPEAVIGSLRFAWNSAISGVTLDPDTGSLSGTFTTTTNRSGKITVSDDIGTLATVNVTLIHQTLSISLDDMEVQAGTVIDYAPAVRLASSEAVYGLIPRVEDALPEGLSMDSSTGRIIGTMPFGTYYVRASVSDLGETQYSTLAIWRGTDPSPLDLDFGVTEGAHGEVVESVILPITEIADNRTVAVNAVSGGPVELRICFDPRCTDTTAWQTQSATIANGYSLQLRAAVPMGHLEERVYRITVSGMSDEWFWTVRSGERDDIVDASTAYPVSITNSDGTPRSILAVHRLYDGIESENVVYIGNNSIILDFGLPVTFDAFYIASQYTGTFFIDVETPLGWDRIYSKGTRSGQVSLGRYFTAQRIKVNYSQGGGYSGGTYLREFRIGRGGPHRFPVFNEKAVYLGESAKQVRIDATAFASPYAPDNSLTFETVSGSLPEGAELLPDGTLNLPSAAETGPGNWFIQVKATDKLGLSTEQALVLFSEGLDASTKMPEIVEAGTGLNILSLYDGVTSSGGTLKANKQVTFDFGEFVTFERIAYSSTDIALRALVGDEWITIGSLRSSNNTPGYSLGEKWTARFVQIPASSSSRSIRELRFGAGEPHVGPRIRTDLPQYLAHLDDAPKSFQIEVTASSPYTDEPLVYEIAAGELPPGATFSEDSGLLTFPTRGQAGFGTWSFTARVTDGLGAYDERQFFIGSAETSSAVTVPEAFIINNTEYAIDPIYDDDLSTYYNLSNSRTQILDFGKYVSANYMIVSSNSAVDDATFTVSAEFPHGWIMVGQARIKKSGSIKFSGGPDGFIVARRFKIAINMSSFKGSTLKIGENEIVPSFGD